MQQEIPVKSRRRWDQETVLNEIRKLETLSPRTVQQQQPSLYGAAVRLFGAWRTAVEQAGYSYDNVTSRRGPGYWSNERILREIRGLRELNSNCVRHTSVGLYSAALRVFGTWQRAVESAGFDYQAIRRDWVPMDNLGLRFRRHAYLPAAS
ncbi:MAG: hypothetical protein NDJ89_17475 [Oligoflexia bacterium]|nr:hypothetical protein [Oligoflexia bacterium]